LKFEVLNLLVFQPDLLLRLNLGLPLNFADSQKFHRARSPEGYNDCPFYEEARRGLHSELEVGAEGCYSLNSISHRVELWNIQLCFTVATTKMIEVTIVGMLARFLSHARGENR